jgi:hypothetical protein
MRKVSCKACLRICCYRVAHAHNAIYGDDWIAGNMLIVGNCDDEGEMTSLTTEWINANLKEIANV